MTKPEKLAVKIQIKVIIQKKKIIMNFSSWLIKKLMRYPEDDSDMHSIVVIKVEIAQYILPFRAALMLGATKSDNVLQCH